MSKTIATSDLERRTRLGKEQSRSWAAWENLQGSIGARLLLATPLSTSYNRHKAGYKPIDTQRDIEELVRSPLQSFVHLGTAGSKREDPVSGHGLHGELDYNSRVTSNSASSEMSSYYNARAVI